MKFPILLGMLVWASIASCGEQKVKKETLTPKQNISAASQNSANNRAKSVTLNSIALNFGIPETLKPLKEFIADVKLVSKYSDSQTLVFGKDSKTWLYDELTNHLSIVAVAGSPEASEVVLPLPNGNYWSYGTNKVTYGYGKLETRSKVVATLETEGLQPKLLGVLEKGLILALGNKIQIFWYQNNGTVDKIIRQDLEWASDLVSQNQFPLAAGGAKNGSGFWFATAETLFAMSQVRNNGITEWWWAPPVSLKSQGLTGELRHLGLWIKDWENLSLMGNALALTSEGVFISPTTTLEVPPVKAEGTSENKPNSPVPPTPKSVASTGGQGTE